MGGPVRHLPLGGGGQKRPQPDRGGCEPARDEERARPAARQSSGDAGPLEHAPGIADGQTEGHPARGRRGHVDEGELAHDDAPEREARVNVEGPREGPRDDEPGARGPALAEHERRDQEGNGERERNGVGALSPGRREWCVATVEALAVERDPLGPGRDGRCGDVARRRPEQTDRRRHQREPGDRAAEQGQRVRSAPASPQSAVRSPPASAARRTVNEAAIVASKASVP